jgi:hypothetical protein
VRGPPYRQFGQIGEGELGTSWGHQPGGNLSAQDRQHLEIDQLGCHQSLIL